MVLWNFLTVVYGLLGRTFQAGLQPHRHRKTHEQGGNGNSLCNDERGCRHAENGYCKKNLICISGKKTVLDPCLGEDEGKLADLAECQPR
jgi:hypothetical protein